MVVEFDDMQQIIALKHISIIFNFCFNHILIYSLALIYFTEKHTEIERMVSYNQVDPKRLKYMSKGNSKIQRKL